MWSVVLAIISIASFIMSSLTWIVTVYKNHKNLKLTIIDRDTWNCFFKLEDKSWSLTISTMLQNFSASPIHITKIALIDYLNNCYTADLRPTFVAHTFRRLIDTDTKWFEKVLESAQFPICLDAYGAKLEYLHFTIPDIPLQKFQIQRIEVWTNKGLIQSFDFPNEEIKAIAH